MAHFAEIDENNIVVRVIVVDNIRCLNPNIKFEKPPDVKLISGNMITASVITKESFGKVGSKEYIPLAKEVKEVSWESEDTGIAYCRKLLGSHRIFVQTSYNGKIRKNYAGVGYFYDKALDAFIPPQPFKSWTLNKETCRWEAPVPFPGKGMYQWDEEKQAWIQLSSEDKI